MSDIERQIYHSENGDEWFLRRDDEGRVFVLHKANLSSGGAETQIDIGDVWEEARQARSIKP